MSLDTLLCFSIFELWKANDLLVCPCLHSVVFVMAFFKMLLKPSSVMPASPYLNYIMLPIPCDLSIVDCTRGTSGAPCLDWRQNGKAGGEIFLPFPLSFLFRYPRRIVDGVLGVVCTERSHEKGLLGCKGPKDNKRHAVNAQHLHCEGQLQAPLPDNRPGEL